MFIGLKMHRSITNIISMLRSTINDKEKYYNWVSGNNLHLTLLFLGMQETDDLDEMYVRIDKVVKLYNDFRIDVKGTGAFSKNNSNKALFLGIDENNNHLSKINYDLMNELDIFMKKRNDISSFFPHITIARKRKKYINNKIDVKSFLNSVYFPMEFHVKYFTLFKSVSNEKGVRYIKIKDFSLL